jgi:hypothetical protein
LNTVEGDASIVSLTANEFTLQAGSYEIEASCPVFGVDDNQAGLALSASSTPDISVGSCNYAPSTVALNNSSFIKCVVNPISATAYKIVHRCGTTNTSGFGAQCNFGVNNIYTIVKIRKLY